MADLVWALFGARGSGKSHTAKQACRRARRLIIWDTMDEYGEHAAAVASLQDLYALTAGKAFAARYVPRGTDREIAARFGAFCALAFARGNLLLVVEELQRVTRPSSSPAAWADCTLRGRHQGLQIIGISQRPASVDKDFFSNATMVRTGRLNYRDDVLCMANVLNVPMAAVSGLRDRDFIARDMLTGRLWGEGAPGVTARGPAAPGQARSAKKIASK